MNTLLKKPAKITCGIYLYNTLTKKILICHATNSPWNNWTIPKGLKDPNEDAFIAASRELKEETGIELEKIHILKMYSLPEVKYKKQNKILHSYLIVTDSDLSGHKFESMSIADKKTPEIDSWKWVSPEKIKNIHEAQLKNMEQVYEKIQTL